jgi:prolyl-tRNA synthetase
VMVYIDNLAQRLREISYHDRKIVVEIDARDIGGARGWDWIKKGIPLRVEIGPRDIEQNSVYVGRRDKAHSEKKSIKKEQFIAELTNILDEIQDSLFARAEAFRNDHTVTIDDKQAFGDFFTPLNSQKPEIHGGFAVSHWCGEDACEARIKEDLAATIRCIPFEQEKSKGFCISCGKPAFGRAVFAKSY